MPFAVTPPAPLYRLAVTVFTPDRSLAACIAGFLPDTADELSRRLSRNSAAS